MDAAGLITCGDQHSSQQSQHSRDQHSSQQITAQQGGGSGRTRRLAHTNCSQEGKKQALSMGLARFCGLTRATEGKAMGSAAGCGAVQGWADERGPQTYLWTLSTGACRSLPFWELGA